MGTNQNNFPDWKGALHDYGSLFDWSKGFQDRLEMGIFPNVLASKFFSLVLKWDNQFPEARCKLGIPLHGILCKGFHGGTKGLGAKFNLWSPEGSSFKLYCSHLTHYPPGRNFLFTLFSLFTLIARLPQKIRLYQGYQWKGGTFPECLNVKWRHSTRNNNFLQIF